MGIVTSIAIYFVIWWTVLFVVLPVGMRSQADEEDIVLGTAHSAPARFRPGRVIVCTTVLAAVVFVGFYIATSVLGWTSDSLPHIIPGT